MSFPLNIHDDLRRAVQPGASVLLGLSGGVDSAVSLAMLRELGCEVQTVTFRNFCYSECDDLDDRNCCSLDAIDDARALARHQGVHHWVHDVEPAFQRLVIDPFVAAYREAMTPNPCLACNGDVRFPELLRLADQQGCQLVATGHYARTVVDQDGPGWLERGVDRAKDQSYFLSQVPRRVWSRTVFPLGWSTKAAVRDAARLLGLRVAEKVESQDICFVPDGDRSLIFPDGGLGQPGAIVDRRGHILGHHRGLGRYTVGQRRGLGVAFSEPLYVLALSPDTNQLIVGPRAELAVRRVVCDHFVAHGPDLDGARSDRGPFVIQIRHRHAGARAASWRRDGDRFEVELAEPVDGVAPGQGLVLYDGDRVVGSGRIVRPNEDGGLV